MPDDLHAAYDANAAELAHIAHEALQVVNAPGTEAEQAAARVVAASIIDRLNRFSRALEAWRAGGRVGPMPMLSLFS